jgi:hypothetical protein
MSINSGVINGSAINGVAGAISIPQVDAADFPAIITSDVALTVLAFNDERDAVPAVITNPEPPQSVWLRVHDDPAAVTSDINAFIIKATVRDTAVVISSANTLLVAKQTTRDAAIITSAVISAVFIREDAADAVAAVITSAVDIDSIITVVRDPAIITSAVATTLRTSRLTVRDTAIIASGVSADATVLIARDSVAAVIVSNASPVGYLYEIARDADAAVVTSAAVDLLTGGLVVRDAFVGVSRALPFSLIRSDIREQAYLASWVSLEGGSYAGGWATSDVWTANVDTWGMSRYISTGITNQGTRWAVSDGGLFEVGATDEDLLLKTGFMDFKSPVKKRISNVYLMGVHDNPLSVTATAEVKGTRATHNYITKVDNAAEGTTVRADLGKGFNSTFYQFQIGSVGRANLFGGEALMADTRRKI